MVNAQWKSKTLNERLTQEKNFYIRIKIIKNTLAQMLLPFWLMRILCFVRKAQRATFDVERSVRASAKPHLFCFLYLFFSFCIQHIWLGWFDMSDDLCWLVYTVCEQQPASEHCKKALLFGALYEFGRATTINLFVSTSIHRDEHEQMDAFLAAFVSIFFIFFLSLSSSFLFQLRNY